MIEQSALTPTQFVEGFNLLIEYNLPSVIIEGELADFRVSKNKWLYFNIKDEKSLVACFGTIFQTKNPIEDGMMIRLTAVPRMHNKFGFSLNVISILPIGEGSIRRSAEILKAQLLAEGLFSPERKRPLPFAPQKIGLITSEGSAAYHDFIKILNERWCGLEVIVSDVLVQGENAPTSIVESINILNQSVLPPEVIVITRGGGSAEDLMAFDNEAVVRAIASSRVPTLVAIGHEVDLSLAELAADMRASTPSNAVSMLVPDKKEALKNLSSQKKSLCKLLSLLIDSKLLSLGQLKKDLLAIIERTLSDHQTQIMQYKLLVEAFNPNNILKRGYSMLSINGKLITSANQVKTGQKLTNILADGKIVSMTREVKVDKA